MADTTTGRVALFSIRPTYVQALMTGIKKVEFRRQTLRNEVTRVVVYASAPIQQVVGTLEVSAVESLTPRRAWAKFGAVGGIGKEAFDNYYNGAMTAFVIRVCNPTVASTPFQLTDIAEGLRPPQSFMYLADDVLDRANALLL